MFKRQCFRRQECEDMNIKETETECVQIRDVNLSLAIPTHVYQAGTEDIRFNFSIFFCTVSTKKIAYLLCELYDLGQNSESSTCKDSKASSLKSMHTAKCNVSNDFKRPI
jgi:hypothetical protein